MRIVIRLRQLLAQHDRDRKGIMKQIADETGISWDVVDRLYHGKARQVYFHVLERLCDWLHRNHMGEGLPGALFGTEPSGLLSALAAHGELTIYVGEYHEELSHGFTRISLSRADDEVGSLVVALLSGAMAPLEKRAPLIQFEKVYVPSYIASGASGASASKSRSAGPPEAVMRLFRRMRSRQSASAAVLIGSQRANYLTEVFVADLFGCTPFAPGSGVVPFHIVWPGGAKPPPASCFGGPGAPGSVRDEREPGVYYRTDSGKWAFLPSRRGQRDVGLAIIRQDHARGRIEMAIFGVSGQATSAMGEILRRHPDRLWPAPEPIGRGLDLRMCLCEFASVPRRSGSPAAHRGALQLINVMPLHREPVSPPAPQRPSRTPAARRRPR
jgi:DNA-binding Xre family transcriptional regulator